MSFRTLRDRARLLSSALFATNWNKSKAAEQLHSSRRTVCRKIAKYRLDARGAGRADRATVIEDDPSPRGG